MKNFYYERSVSNINPYGFPNKKKSATSIGHWSSSIDKMDGCGRVVKLCLIASNVAMFVGGAVTLGVGLWMYVSRSFASTLLSSNMYIASLLVVAAMGAVLMLLSVLGCCAAVREVKCMLLTYYTLGFLIFVVLLVSGILQFLFIRMILTSLERDMHASIPYYGVEPSYTTAWDDTQSNLECCGVKSWRVWGDHIPSSCCREVYPGRRQDCNKYQDTTTMYMEGCLMKTVDLLRHNAMIIGVVAIFVVILMLLALILACALFTKIQ